MNSLIYWCLRSAMLVYLLAFAAANSDLVALLALKGSFQNASSFLLNWQATSMSPCSWPGVKCRNDRVMRLELSGHHLSGVLSAHVGNLTALVHLNLSNNLLVGAIPAEIGKLANLKVLDLHRNRFDGQIPESITRLKGLRELDLSYNCLAGQIPVGGVFSTLPDDSLKGNPGLCTSDTCSGHEVHFLNTGMLAIMISALAVLGLLAVAGGIIRWRRLQSFSELKSEKSVIGVGHLVDYTLQELKAATAEFNQTNVLGQGVLGIVYRGTSTGGFNLAVKLLKNADFKVDFLKDMELLSRARHKNVASLLGCCYTSNAKLVVSEYVPGVNLTAFLSGQRQCEFDWDKRKTVILGVAKGLSYLHSLTPEVIHGSLKPSNILIEDDFTPKLTDFGLYSIIQERGFLSVSHAPDNAPYYPPEMTTPTLKADSYGFGVLLVQLVTGQPPWQLLETSKAAGLKFREWVLIACNREEFVDGELKKPPFWEVKKIVQLAVMCMETLPVLRPGMDEVVEFLVEEVLISNKSMELDGLFIDLIMDTNYDDGFELQGHEATRKKNGESLLPSGSASKSS